MQGRGKSGGSWPSEHINSTFIQRAKGCLSPDGSERTGVSILEGKVRGQDRFRAYAESDGAEANCERGRGDAYEGRAKPGS